MPIVSKYCSIGPADVELGAKREVLRRFRRGGEHSFSIHFTSTFTFDHCASDVLNAPQILVGSWLPLPARVLLNSLASLARPPLWRSCLWASGYSNTGRGGWREEWTIIDGEWEGKQKEIKIIRSRRRSWRRRRGRKGLRIKASPPPLSLLPKKWQLGHCTSTIHPAVDLQRARTRAGEKMCFEISWKLRSLKKLWWANPSECIRKICM